MAGLGAQSEAFGSLLRVSPLTASSLAACPSATLQNGYKVDLGSRKVAASVHATSATGTVGAYHGGYGGGAPSGYQAVGAGDESQWGSSNGGGGGSYQQPAARDEWGSGWDDAPSGGAARGSAGGRQQHAAADAQWSGWDEGGASPSHAVPANGKAADADDWGKW